MNIIFFKELVKGQVDLGPFLVGIKDEVLDYMKKMISNQAVSNIVVTDSHEDLFFKASELEYLLTLYLDSKILEWELDYILNVLEISDLDMDERVEEIIFTLSTPEINTPITGRNVQYCLEYLRGKALKIPLKQISSERYFDFKRRYRSIFNY